MVRVRWEVGSYTEARDISVEEDVRVPSNLSPSWVGTVTVRTAVEGLEGSARDSPV